jgi:hypothetical protein
MVGDKEIAKANPQGRNTMHVPTQISMRNFFIWCFPFEFYKRFNQVETPSYDKQCDTYGNAMAHE